MTSRSARTRMPAASSARRAAAPSAKRKWPTPRPSTTHAPPPSTLTPARPSAAPISARAPGRFSNAMARSFIVVRSGVFAHKLRQNRAKFRIELGRLLQHREVANVLDQHCVEVGRFLVDLNSRRRKELKAAAGIDAA